MTLAQDFLENGRPFPTGSSELDQLVRWTDGFVRRRLMAPKVADVKHAQRTAERFVFEENPGVVVQRLVDSGQVKRSVQVQLFKLPSDNTWIEYPIEIGGERDQVWQGKAGIMIGKVWAGDGRDDPDFPEVEILMAIVIKSPTHDFIVPVSLVRAPETIMEKGVLRSYRPYYIGDKAFAEIPSDAWKQIEKFSNDLVDAMFLLSVPRAVEYVDGSFGPRKEKVQRKTGKPFVEFRRVRVRIGVAEVRRTPGGGTTSGHGGHKKLHRVMPFIRTYVKGRAVPKVSVVEEFWRGDPSLGVIIKERHLVAPPSTLINRKD